MRVPLLALALLAACSTSEIQNNSDRATPQTVTHTPDQSGGEARVPDRVSPLTEFEDLENEPELQDMSFRWGSAERLCINSERAETLEPGNRLYICEATCVTNPTRSWCSDE